MLGAACMMSPVPAECIGPCLGDQISWGWLLGAGCWVLHACCPWYQQIASLRVAHQVSWGWERWVGCGKLGAGCWMLGGRRAQLATRHPFALVCNLRVWVVGAGRWGPNGCVLHSVRRMLGAAFWVQVHGMAQRRGRRMLGAELA